MEIVQYQGHALSHLDVESVIEGFVREQDVRESSRALYSRTLRLFFRWVQESGRGFSSISRADILSYKDSLLKSGKSPLTVGGYLTVVRKFYEFAEANQFFPNVAKGVKTPTRKQQFKKQALTVEDSKRLLEYFSNTTARDYALANLLIRVGLRTIEVSRARVGDIEVRAGRRILNVHGKGRDSKDAFVVLTDKAYEPLQAYLESRGPLSLSSPLFPSDSHRNEGEALTTRSISRVIKDGLKAIGLTERAFSAHSLRHTTAVNILRAGGRLEDAQNVLRHSNPSTTQIYTATIKEEMRLSTPAEMLIDSVL